MPFEPARLRSFEPSSLHDLRPIQNDDVNPGMSLPHQRGEGAQAAAGVDDPLVTEGRRYWPYTTSADTN